MHFASRATSGTSMLSLLARPYRPEGSVAAYLQDQARSPTTDIVSRTQDYKQKDMQRLESMLQELEDLPINDDDNANVQSPNVTPPTPFEPLFPGYRLSTALPVHTEPSPPPTPAELVTPTSPEEPVVRVTMHVWDAMDRDLEALKAERRALELKVARLEKAKQIAPQQAVDYNDELQTQIGKLQYQNEANKIQKATMARTLSEKDMEIKQLQLKLASVEQRAETAKNATTDYAQVVEERDYLQDTLNNDRAEGSRLLTDLTNAKNREIETLSKKIEDLQEALNRAIVAASASTQSEEYKALAENRLARLTQCEKQLSALKNKYGTEHTKVNDLEDWVEDLRGKLSQVGDLQGQLNEKSRECERFRTNLRKQEKVVEDYKQRIMRVSHDGKALRGAAHLVVPKADTRFSHLVLGCAECYTKNITCDDKARCRHCTENNEKCARWRCSLKHVLGQCPNVPCSFPHESDGWLLATERRPQW